jgi:hypothetical protein
MMEDVEEELNPVLSTKHIINYCTPVILNSCCKIYSMCQVISC